MIDGIWLLQQHRRLTARHAAQLGRSIAEDLASEAVTRCLRHPAPDGRQGPWLERIFRNLLADHLRHQGRAIRFAPVLPAPTSLPTPEESALRAELHAGLAGAWKRMQPEQREALLARFCEDSALLAQQSSLPPPTVRTRIHRGLAVLRQALSRLAALLPIPLSPSLHRMTATLAPLAIAALVLAPARFTAKAPAPPTLAQRSTAAGVPPVPSAAPGPRAVSPPASRALSQPAAPATHRPASVEPRGAVGHFDFDDDEVVGDLQRPDTFIIQGDAPAARHSSLIEIPSSFLAAIAKSMEDI